MGAVFIHAIFVAGLSGCAGMGHRTITGDCISLNRADAASSNEQLLLNLVRLGAGRPAYFVEIQSMLSRYRLKAGGRLAKMHNDLHGEFGPALRAAYPITGDPVPENARRTTANANLEYSATSTIDYRPVEGEEFSKRLLAPIAPSILIFLAQSGWSIDQLFACCVQQINGISNRVLQDTGSIAPPDAGRFSRLIVLMRKVQNCGKSYFTAELENGVMTGVLYIPETIPGLESEMAELRTMLGYPLQGELRLRVTGNSVSRAPDEVAIQTRSVLATMSGLARECIGQAAHIRNHKAGPDAGEKPTDPEGAWMRIQQNPLPQINAFVQVHHNGYWYFISKSDRSSKRTFALITYLLSLQASASYAGEPLLTVSTKR